MPRYRLWGLFAVVSVVVALLFAGGGHGSYAPAAIFGSWGLLPWAVVVHGASGSLDTICFFVGPLLYLLVLYTRSGRLVGRRGPRSYWWVPVQHAIGAAFVVALLPAAENVAAPITAVGYLIATCSSLGFFALDSATFAKPDACPVKEQPKVGR
jgi:hypothetical protein